MNYIKFISPRWQNFDAKTKATEIMLSKIFTKSAIIDYSIYKYILTILE